MQLLLKKKKLGENDLFRSEELSDSSINSDSDSSSYSSSYSCYGSESVFSSSSK